jgi:hypothetical protein
MVSIGKLGAGQERYYLDKVAEGAEDYYSGEAEGYWLGEAAAVPIPIPMFQESDDCMTELDPQIEPNPCLIRPKYSSDHSRPRIPAGRSPTKAERDQLLIRLWSEGRGEQEIAEALDLARASIGPYAVAIPFRLTAWAASCPAMTDGRPKAR